jgi:hypothetical protein
MNDALIASLTALHTDAEDAVTLDGDGYLDWSIRLTDGGRQLEVSDGTDAMALDLSRADLVRLHAALTLTLLADQSSAG